jgi:uncharacterized protein (DUF2062 family)
MKKLLLKIKGLMQQGTSPHGLALSTTLGILFGLFPVLGITTWAIPLIALRLRLNLALMLALSYVFWPLQIFLIIPFLRFGEWLWEMPPFPLSLEKLQAAFSESVLGALNDFWWANLTAAGGWLAIGIPLGVGLYFLLRKVFEWLLLRRKTMRDG